MNTLMCFCAWKPLSRDFLSYLCYHSYFGFRSSVLVTVVKPRILLSTKHEARHCIIPHKVYTESLNII